MTSSSLISPIRVSPDGRYFTDPAGTPLFFHADTQWELFRLATPDIALRILRDRQSKGFSASLVMLLGTELGSFDPKAAVAPDHFNLYGSLPWVNNDPLRPDEAYFRHVDSILPLALAANQTLIVGVYHKWHERVITPANARAWARWVANRYRSFPNIIWSMYPKPLPDFIPVCRELAAGLAEGDRGGHLISCHPDPSPCSSSFMHNEPWLAFNMIQTSVKYDLIPSMVAADYALSPAKPVVMAEGGYEGFNFGKTQTPHDIRKQAFWTQLAGGHHTYGCKALWKDPVRQLALLDSPGAQFLKTFRDIITSLPEWWRLLPDQSIISSGHGSGYSANLSARHPDNHWRLVYLSEPSTVTLVVPPMQYTATWIDPRTGNRTPCATKQHDFTTPSGWEDALLLLQGS